MGGVSSYLVQIEDCKMHALLALLAAVMAVSAVAAGIASAFSKAAIFALLALAPVLFRYHARLYVIFKTLPRDVK